MEKIPHPQDFQHRLQSRDRTDTSCLFVEARYCLGSSSICEKTARPHIAFSSGRLHESSLAACAIDVQLDNHRFTLANPNTDAIRIALAQ
jgi:hypothetical protein